MAADTGKYGNGETKCNVVKGRNEMYIAEEVVEAGRGSKRAWMEEGKGGDGRAAQQVDKTAPRKVRKCQKRLDTSTTPGLEIANDCRMRERASSSRAS